MSGLATVCFGLLLLGASVAILTTDHRRKAVWLGLILISGGTWFFPAGQWWAQ